MARIMVVDDEEKLLESLGRILTNEGYEVKLVSSGEKALSLLVEFMPDVILLDVRMPEMDGLEVCRRIRNDKGDNIKSIPIIMITGYFYEKEEIEKFDADDCIEKPMEKEEILARIKCALKIGKLVDKSERAKAYLEELKKIRNKSL